MKQKSMETLTIPPNTLHPSTRRPLHSAVFSFAKLCLISTSKSIPPILGREAVQIGEVHVSSGFSSVKASNEVIT